MLSVMKLHNYFRSSAAFQVRIALEFKGLAYDHVAVQITRGKHRQAPYVVLCADGLVPLLEVDGNALSQSMAIIGYLDELYPAPALLPADALEAFERQLAHLPASVYCYGDTLTLADCCLVPQIFNAERFEVRFDGLPLTMAACHACMVLPAFQKAQPSACPDSQA